MPHYPRPWTYSEKTGWIYDAAGNNVLGALSTEQGVFLVKIVNEHDKLVDIAKQLTNLDLSVMSEHSCKLSLQRFNAYAYEILEKLDGGALWKTK